MDRLELSRSEVDDISSLVDEAVEQGRNLELELVLDLLPVLAHELPIRVRHALNFYRLGRMSGTFVISGYEVDQERLGRTPAHWRERSKPSRAEREEFLLLMYASLIGDPFAWATQQDGYLIHDVLPIRGHEYEQLGSSSEELLTWHTEDAFHPLRSDFLLFACLRNPYSAATTIGSVDDLDLDLSESVRDVLFEERFHILPDESHRPHNNSSASDVDFTLIETMRDRPAPIAALFGDRERPYIRVDPYFMSVPDEDGDAREALDHLVKVMDDRMVDMELAAGEYCFIDNYRIVHGRKPFHARLDGTDRWLKRVNVTRDMRKSRAARVSYSVRGIQ